MESEVAGVEMWLSLRALLRLCAFPWAITSIGVVGRNAKVGYLFLDLISLSWECSVPILFPFVSRLKLFP